MTLLQNLVGSRAGIHTHDRFGSRHRIGVCRRGIIQAFFCLVIVGSIITPNLCAQNDRLGSFEPLTIEGDIALELVDGVDRFLLKQIADVAEVRKRKWNTLVGNAENKNAARQSLRKMLGIDRLSVQANAARSSDISTEIEFVSTLQTTPQLVESDAVEAFQVRWKTDDTLTAEGILIRTKSDPIARVVVIPDADQTPEQLCGLTDDLPSNQQIARQLASQGCQVIVVSLVNRGRAEIEWPYNHKIVNREFLYRAAFEMGRTLAGYEVNKVLAAIDRMELDQKKLPLGVVGFGEGGMLALYAAALDTRIDATLVSGYFRDRANMWQLPIERNIFGLLNQFGDAELAALVAPRSLIVEASQFPVHEVPSGGDNAPVKLETPSMDEVAAEFNRAIEITKMENRKDAEESLQLLGDGSQPAFVASTNAYLKLLGIDPQELSVGPIGKVVRVVDVDARQRRQILDVDVLNQRLLADSGAARQKFMSNLDMSSVESFVATSESYRKIFREDIVGHFDLPLQSAHPRIRPLKIDEGDDRSELGLSESVDYYEVVLDVFPDVIAYGILCLPKELNADERHPVIVCQHGLEGRPQDVIGKANFAAYKAFASKLAERGYITFAPQNLYIFRDRFRTLQRKSNPIGKTLFSVIVPQHQQVVNWLKTLPVVDEKRIAFYGLSYGGKSAMRIPPLVPDYCLSICSADFNEWVDKNASTRNLRSYAWRNEYEIFEWNLGNTFNYAEMATLIAPRPFMVERGHFDGVGDDWTVAWEFAKVRHLYQAKLGIGDRCEIEWFVGPHTINGVGTFEFLDKHLKK